MARVVISTGYSRTLLADVPLPCEFMSRCSNRNAGVEAWLCTFKLPSIAAHFGSSFLEGTPSPKSATVRSCPESTSWMYSSCSSFDGLLRDVSLFERVALSRVYALVSWDHVASMSCSAEGRGPWRLTTFDALWRPLALDDL
ncbi:hypothetical protein MRX96_047019 [Rhipicephalus microplus]